MDILMVLAHPDDEVIFGWPIVQRAKENNDQLFLLTLIHNREKYGSGPTGALAKVCDVNRIGEVKCARQETNFYRLPTRYTDVTLKKVCDDFTGQIGTAIEAIEPDFIFTHNPMGEYGHGDHRAVFNLVSTFHVPLLLTDICFYNKCHLSSNHVPDIYKEYFYYMATEKYHCKLDLKWYEEMKKIYEKHKAWSWGGHDPVKECNLYKFT